MLSVAIRIAQRMGIDSESALAKRTAFEAEMCRRLWWSLVQFDTRISEMAGHTAATLAPTWDCRIPLNVNDSELHPEMKELPAVQGKPTEALYAVVRSELGDFVRHTMFHLDFTNPSLKSFAKEIRGPVPEGSELDTLEKMIEEKYLKFCDPGNPLHFLTIWTARAYLANCRLMEHHSRYSDPSVHEMEAERDAAIVHALSRLQCDTKLATSPLTKGFLWLAHLYFPFPAYIFVVQDLRRRPIYEKAEQAWEVMSDNYEAQFIFLNRVDSPFFEIFSSIVLQAWEAREVALRQLGKPLMPPRIVSSIRNRLAQTAQNAREDDEEQTNGILSMGIDDFDMSMPMDFACDSMLYNLRGQDASAVMVSGMYSYPGQASSEIDMNQSIYWNMVNAQTAESSGQPPPY